MNLYQAIQIHKYMTPGEYTIYSDAIFVILNYTRWSQTQRIKWMPVEI